MIVCDFSAELLQVFFFLLHMLVCSKCEPGTIVLYYKINKKFKFKKIFFLSLSLSLAKFF